MQIFLPMYNQIQYKKFASYEVNLQKFFAQMQAEFLHQNLLITLESDLTTYPFGWNHSNK